MKRIISFFLLSVYCAFVAGTLVSPTDDSASIYRSSEFTGKYISSTDDGIAYFVAQPANSRTVQKHLPFNGKIKLTRPNIPNELPNNTISLRQASLRSSFTSSEKPSYASVSIYLRNRILLI